MLLGSPIDSLSYAEMDLATPVAAEPTEKNHLATSWPPSISANAP